MQTDCCDISFTEYKECMKTFKHLSYYNFIPNYSTPYSYFLTAHIRAACLHPSNNEICVLMGSSITYDSGNSNFELSFCSLVNQVQSKLCEIQTKITNKKSSSVKIQVTSDMS